MNTPLSIAPIPTTLPILIHENEDYGQTGFVLRQFVTMDNPLVDFGSGEMLAHDIVEHINGLDAVGTIHDELVALGAMFAVRVETGVMSTQKWAGMFYDQFVTYCNSPYALPYSEDPDSASANPVNAPLSKALTALQDDYGIVRTPEEQKAFEDFCRAAQCLVVQGYQRLLRGYAWAGNSGKAALTLFNHIQSSVQQHQSAVDDELIGTPYVLSIHKLSATMEQEVFDGTIQN